MSLGYGFIEPYMLFFQYKGLTCLVEYDDHDNVGFIQYVFIERCTYT